MRRVAAFVVGCLVLAACSSGVEAGSAAVPEEGPSLPATTDSVTTTLPSRPTATTAGPSATTPAAVPELEVFIAAIDAALVDTTYAGAAFDDPEVFLATGQLMCEMLDEGAAVDDVLSAHLDALADSMPEGLGDDEATLSGVVLGAAVEAICTGAADVP